MKKNQLKPRAVEILGADQSLGRLASAIASALRGKNLPTYDPAALPAVKVIVKDPNEVQLPKRADKRIYYWHTGSPGGLRSRTLKERFQKSPEDTIRHAVRGMLPKNRLRSRYMRLLEFERTK